MVSALLKLFEKSKLDTFFSVDGDDTMYGSDLKFLNLFFLGKTIQKNFFSPKSDGSISLYKNSFG